MEVLIEFVMMMILLLTFSVMTGWAALSLNRKFWLWFVIGFFLPFIGVVIILCLPANEKKVQQALLKPASSEEIFDRVLELKEPGRINEREIQFLARA